MANKDTALDTLVREELGIDPEELGGSAYVRPALLSVCSRSARCFRCCPFFCWWTFRPFWPLSRSGLALIVIGAGTSLFTGRGLLFSALRQLAIGYGAALVTYGIGRLAGVALG